LPQAHSFGRHGTGKSFLFERLAQALGLVYRFYNASLINYDDLVGIPVPGETQSSLCYITTPTAIWDAEVVFVDEFNRTRPDLQNKLFPIIYERRVQGVEPKDGGPFRSTLRVLRAILSPSGSGSSMLSPLLSQSWVLRSVMPDPSFGKCHR
jgi:hypothetical protein